MGETPAGFPVLKHPVLLRLLIGHLADPDDHAAMLEEYVARLAARAATWPRCASRCGAADAPGEPFHYPSLVADWGLDYFDSETPDRAAHAAPDGRGGPGTRGPATAGGRRPRP